MKLLRCLLAAVLMLGMATPVLAGTVQNEAPAAEAASLAANDASASAYGAARFPQARLNLVQGKYTKMPAIAYDMQGKKVKLSYKSSKPKVASVSQNGTIKALKVGTAKITASGKGVSRATVTIRVVRKAVKATGVNVNYWQEGSLYVGDSRRLTASVQPAGATHARLTYRSLNTEVAKVDATGMVTAVGTGKAIIEVRCGQIAERAYVETGKRPTVINKTIYDAHGISITADTMQFLMGESRGHVGGSDNKLYCTVRNNSKHSIRVNFINVRVNGLAVEPFWGHIQYPDPGSVKSDALVINNNVLAAAGIREINTIAFNFEIELRDSGLKHLYSDTITLQV